MPGKQHTGFKCRLLSLLFLFINGISTAAPVIKATTEDNKQALSVRLAQHSHIAENEEESRLAASYVVQLTHFSFKRQPAGRLFHTAADSQAAELYHTGRHKSYNASASFLPRPAYYTFLFRYKLF